MPARRLSDRDIGRRAIAAVLAVAWVYGLVDQFPRIDHVITYLLITALLVTVARL